MERKGTWPLDVSGGEQTERCVLCGEMTDEPKDTDISQRKCYVPGVGQLCEKCCWETYGVTDIRSKFD